MAQHLRHTPSGGVAVVREHETRPLYLPDFVTGPLADKAEGVFHQFPETVKNWVSKTGIRKLHTLNGMVGEHEEARYVNKSIPYSAVGMHHTGTGQIWVGATKDFQGTLTEEVGHHLDESYLHDEIADHLGLPRHVTGEPFAREFRKRFSVQATNLSSLADRIAALAVRAAEPKYGCLMAMLPGLDLTPLSSQIDPADLVGDGVETEPHCTVLYGFNTDFDVGRLGQLLSEYGPKFLRLGKLERFECPEYDVIKLRVDSLDLRELNAVLNAAFKDAITPSKWQYNPHVTVAYVKKGAATNIDEGADYLNRVIKVGSLLYSLPEKKGRRTFELTKKGEFEQAVSHASLPKPEPEVVQAAVGVSEYDPRARAEDGHKKAIKKALAVAEATALANLETQQEEERKKRKKEAAALALLLLLGSSVVAYRRMAAAAASRTAQGASGTADLPTPQPDAETSPSGLQGGSATVGNAEASAPAATGVVSDAASEGAEASAFAQERQTYLTPFAHDIQEAMEAQANAPLPEGTTLHEHLDKVAEEIAAGRGTLIAQTETQAAYGSSTLRALRRAGFTTAMWVQVDRPSKRESHEDNMNLGPQPLGYLYPNGQRYPGDPAGGAGECINCLCVLEGVGRAPITASQTIQPEAVMGARIKQHQSHSATGKVFTVREHEDKRPAGKWIAGHENASLADKVLVRSVAEHFKIVDTPAVCSLKITTQEELGEFTAGGKTFQKAGDWDIKNRQVRAIANPDVLAHELGHAEFDFVKENALYGIDEAARKHEPKNGLWKLGSESKGLLRASGEIANPQTSRQRLFNAYLQFKHAHYEEKNLPSDYAKTWAKEPVLDSMEHRVDYEFNDDGEKASSPINLAVELQSHRSLHEAYAEYSAGRVNDRLLAEGLLVRGEVDSSRTFKAMDGPEGRNSFNVLRKLLNEVLKEYYDA